MKKRKILITMLILTLILTLSIGLTSCNDENKNDTTVKTLDSISVVGNSEYYIEDFDFDTAFNVQLKYSDGSTKSTALKQEMLEDPNDYDKVRFMNDTENTGSVVKSFVVNYLGKVARFEFTMKHNPAATNEFTGVKFDSLEIEYNSKPSAGEKRTPEVENLPELPDGKKPKVIYQNNRNTNAGTYNVIAQISAPGYKTLELTAVLKINPKQIARPVFQTTEQNPTPGIVEYNTRQQYVPLDRNNPDYRVTGEIAKKNAGTYSVKVELTNPRNYVWAAADPSQEPNADPINMDWEIAKNKIDLSKVVWKYSSGFTSSGFFLYQDDPAIFYSVMADKFPRELVVADYSIDEDNNILYRQKSDKFGDYKTKVTFKVKSDKEDNYEIDESVDYIKEINWSIRRNRINPEGVIGFINEVNGVVEYTYDGQLHKPYLQNVGEVINGAEIVDPTEGFRDVGTYTYTVTIVKEGYEPLKLTTTCVIKPRYVDIPTIAQKTLYYNGKEQYVQIVGDRTGIVIKGNIYGIEPNEYQLTFMLENTKNYKWRNVPKDQETAVIKNEDTKWNISKITLPSEYFEWKQPDPDYLVYDGTRKVIELDTKGTPGIEVNYSGNGKVNAGEYVVTADIRLLYNPNVYIGIDGFKTSYKDEHKGTLTISKKLIDMSAVGWSKSSFIYRENLDDVQYSVELIGLPEDAPEGLFEYVNDDMYSNYVNLYNEDGILIDKDDIVRPNTADHKRKAKVVIDPNYEPIGFGEAEREKIWEVIENPIGGIIYEDETVVYDPEGYTPIKPTGIDETDIEVHYYHGDSKEDNPDFVTKNVGKYTQRIIVTKKGYSCFEKEIIFEIVPRKIAVPKVTEEAKNGFTFDGTIKNCGIVTDEEKYQIIGLNSAFKAGSYEVKICLNSVINEEGKKVYNYEWQDNTAGGIHEDITSSWLIKQLDISLEQLQAWDYNNNIIYNGTNQEITVKDLPKGIVAKYETRRVDGKDNNGKAINAGEYITKVTYSTVFKGADKVLDEVCYKNSLIFDGKTFESNPWEIKKLDVDASGIRWRINEDKSPAIYYENYKGVPQPHKIDLHIAPAEVNNLIGKMFILDGVFVATQDSATPYKVSATFNDPNGNYNLVNNKDFNQGKFETEWYITRNDLVWLDFDDQEAGIYGIQQKSTVQIKEGDVLEFEEQRPIYSINDPTKESLRQILDEGSDPENYSITYEATDDEGNTYTTGPVTEAGIYKYRIRVNVRGYGQKEFIVTKTINRLAIDRPTVDDSSKPAGPIAYDGNEHSIKIIDNAVVNAQITNAGFAYRIDYASAAGRGKYKVQAVLVNDNFMWKPAPTETEPSTQILYLFDWEIA